MSTSLITYLNFISGLEDATDDELNDIISEHQQFILLGTSDMTASNDAIDSVFNKIDDLARELEEEEIAEESVKLALDAAAVGAIWSFGLGMAAYIPLATTDIILLKEIKAKEDDLNKHLASADEDIANIIGDPWTKYVTLLKKNNNFIAASSPTGLTPQTARNYLYNFMDFLSITDDGLTLDNFRTYVKFAKSTQDDPNISKIYDILDEFTLSDSTKQDQIQKVLEKMNQSELAFGTHGVQKLSMVKNLSYAVWVAEFKISTKILTAAVKVVDGISADESKPAGVFENMSSLEKVTAALTIMVSIVDAYLNVYNIVETVKRYNDNVKVLSDARGQYKEYFQSMYDASVQYNPVQ